LSWGAKWKFEANPVSAPIIVSALFTEQDFQRLDQQRRLYFPLERNQLHAHLTLFHHLPPSCLDELLRRLRAETRAPVPHASLSGLIMLGNGVAYRVTSSALEDVRASLADAFRGLLMPQDQAPWRPHVTVQNKVKPSVAKALFMQLSADFSPRALSISGLAAYSYREGPWEPIAAFRFGSGHPMKMPSPFHPRLTPNPPLL
jgi:2'-5' RNA ligase